MYTSSSLSPLSLSLSEVSVSDSSSSLPAKQPSSASITSCDMYFTLSAENRCGHDAFGGRDGGVGGGGVSSLHTGFCVIGAFRFAGFISSSGNRYPLNYRGISSPSVFLIYPAVQGSICVSQRSVQCLC